MARRTWEQYGMYLLQRWPLTLREVRIALECVKGKKNKEIAGALGISAETVNKHLDRIYRLTEVNGRDQLAAKLLIADIDNTPLQQSLSLAGEGASIVGAGFADTLYASRGERKRPRSVSARSVKSKSAADRSQSTSSASAKQRQVTSQEIITASVGAHASGRWIPTEKTRLTGTECRTALVCADALMEMKAGES